MSDERKKVWIHQFQTRMLLRIGGYWLIYLVAIWNLLFVWRLLVEGPGNLLDQYWRFLKDYSAPLILFLALMPLAAWDAVKFAHRLVGPIVRVRHSLREITAGNPVRPLRFRKGDYLGELRDDFNGMLEALQRRGVTVLKPAEAEEPSAERKPA